MSTDTRRVRSAQVTLTSVMGPTDANLLGNVHGGVIMKLVDEAGGIAAARHAQRQVVTVVIDSMTFISPVHVGDLLRLDASVNWVGHTSMEVGVRVQAEDVLTGALTHTNSAFCVYVALDMDGHPVPVPGLSVETDDERRRFAEGAARQQLRLARRTVRS